MTAITRELNAAADSLERLAAKARELAGVNNLDDPLFDAGIGSEDLRERVYTVTEHALPAIEGARRKLERLNERRQRSSD